jgi:hypothetical protein
MFEDYQEKVLLGLNEELESMGIFQSLISRSFESARAMSLVRM